MKTRILPLILIFALCIGVAAAAARAESAPDAVVLGGQTLTGDEKELDLSGLAPQDIPACIEAIAKLPHLEQVYLDPAVGTSPWTLDQAGQLVVRYPDLQVHYTATAFGTIFHLTDQVVSFNDINLANKVDRLRAVLPYLAHVERLDMENCGIPDEEMAQLRADFPTPKIVWRVRMRKYSCRTDAIMIRFSNDVDSERLHDRDTKPLMYCNEIKYMDLGHDRITDAWFTAYMPDLEVLILAVGSLSDISALQNCPQLEYLEIFTGSITDLTPLAGLKNLKHLNIANNQITDISPLFELDLERLWLARNPIPQEQIDEFRRRFPNCQVCAVGSNPTGEGWRGTNSGLAPRYILLRQQFCYDMLRTNTYSAFNDPNGTK